MKTVLITGVGKGIGRALAEKFLTEGYFVIGTYLFSKPVFKNENFFGIPLDLSSSKSISACCRQIVRQHRLIDIQINNAGALLDEDEIMVKIDKLRATLEINLIGPIDLTERLISLMTRGSHIVNVASSAGSLSWVGIPGKSHYPFHYPSYKISKTALNMYTRTLALRLKSDGITVSSVHPGWVKTDMGGQGADMTPEQAAEHIYKLSVKPPETGNFWHAGKKIPW